MDSDGLVLYSKRNEENDDRLPRHWVHHHLWLGNHVLFDRVQMVRPSGLALCIDSCLRYVITPGASCNGPTSVASLSPLLSFLLRV